MPIYSSYYPQFSLDFVGLQFCLLENPSGFFDIFQKSFITKEPKFGEIVSGKGHDKQTEAKDLELLGYLGQDMCQMICEVIHNGIQIPFLLHKMMKIYYREAKEKRSLSKCFYKDSLFAYLKTLLTICAPIQLKKFQKFLKFLINDQEIVESFIESHAEIDRQKSTLRLKSEKGVVKNQDSIDVNVIWYSTDILKELTEGNKQQLDDSANPFFVLKVNSNLNSLLLHQSYVNGLLKQISKASINLFNLPKPELIAKAYLRLIVSLMDSIDPQRQILDERTTKDLYENDLCFIISVLRMKLENHDLVKLFERRLNRFARIHFLTTEVNGEADSETESVTQTKKDESSKKEKYKEIFERKKKKIMARMSELKSKFFVGLTSASEQFVESLGKESSSNEENVCTMTQEKLNDSMTFYKYCQIHHYNVNLIKGRLESRR